MQCRGVQTHGTPLLFRSSGNQASETESQSRSGCLPDAGEALQGDERGNVEYHEGAPSNDGEEFSFEEFLRTGDNDFWQSDSFH